MKPTTLIAFVTSLATVLTSACFAQSEKDPSPERAAVLALDRQYEAAFAKGDAKALVEFFGEDAEYTTEDGNVLRGRAEIDQSIRDGLKVNKGAKLAITLDSVSLLSPEIALEKGTSAVTAKDGETSSSRFSAIYVKKDGQWKIGHLIETLLPPETPRERLQELAWLVGTWEEKDTSQDLTVRSQYQWGRGGNFLTRNVTVKRGGETTLEGFQIIGWDPIEQRICSWTFDGEGGFAEGYFVRDGERWLLRETGVSPDGSRTSGDQTLTKLSSERSTWESNNRTLDGEPQPSIGRIEINRVKEN